MAPYKIMWVKEPPINYVRAKLSDISFTSPE